MSSNLSLIEQNRLLSQEVKRRIDQMAAINSVASAVSQSLDLDITLGTALQVVLDVVGAEASGISLIDEEAEELVLRAQLGWVNDFVVSNPMRIPLGTGMSGQVVDRNDIVVYNELDGTEEYAVPSFREEHFRSIAMAPMHARGGIIGVLSIMSYVPNSFNDDVVSVLRVIADTVGVAISNARLYEERVENANRLTAVLDSTADGIIATDRNSRISLVNQAAEVMLKVNQEELIGVPLREAPIPDRVCDSLMQALKPDGTKTFQVTLENERVIAVIVSPVLIDIQVDRPAGQDGWVMVLQDVTHLREAEIARSQFIQAAAHDMRNPLSVTRSSLLLLREMLDENNDRAAEIINLAVDGAERLQGLIDDLLHLEHIESGYNIELEPISLIDVLTEVANESRPLMLENAIGFTLDFEEPLPMIEGDISWLKRALHNYLENAAKYTPQGGAVTFKAYVRDEMVHLEVQDNGPGIPAKDQSKIYDRFYRVDSVQGKIRGSGLGLAIVKSVAEVHNGMVYLKSEEGKGSIFGLTIPVYILPALEG